MKTKMSAPAVYAHRDLLFLSFTAILAVIFFCWGINSWRFSFVGDDWDFYSFAVSIVHKNFLVNWFDLNGVYGQNSVLVSIWQAFFLKILGPTNFAWRFSNIILILPLSYFFYRFAQLLFDRKVALFATLLLQSSFYLANFSKIGYPQPQFFLFFILTFYILIKLAHHETYKNYFFLGVILGLSIYMRIGVFYPLLAWPLLLLFKKSHVHFHKLLLTFMVYCLLAIPGILSFFANGAVTQNSLDKTVVHREFHDNRQIAINVMDSFLVFYHGYDYEYNHFVSGAYVDLTTQIFLLWGLFITLMHIHQKKYLVLLLSYIMTAVFLGLSSPYAYTPVTRGIFLMPFAFLFAAIGLSSFLTNLRLVYHQNAVIFVGLIFLLIVSANVYESQIGTFKKTGYTGTALILKTLQEANTKSHATVYLLLSRNSSYDSSTIPLMMQAYQLNAVSYHVDTLASSSEVPCSADGATQFLSFTQDALMQTLLKTNTCLNGRVIWLDPSFSL